MSVSKRIDFDSLETAKAFSEKLSGFKGTNAVIICTRSHLVNLGERITGMLKLPLDMVACRPIMDPANGNKSIGSVSSNDVILGEVSYDLPQDYLTRQIRVIRSSLNSEMNAFSGLRHFKSLWNTEAILLCDSVDSSDAVMASIESVSRMMPSRITIAAITMTDAALRALSGIVDEVVCLADPLVAGIGAYAGEFSA